MKYKGNSNEVQGISFSKGDYKFKGSEIDRSLSYAKLASAIKEQRLNPEKSLADQLREAIRNKEQVKAPETHYLRQALSAGTELLGGLMANMPDEDDTPEIKRRKRNQQEQSRGISR